MKNTGIAVVSALGVVALAGSLALAETKTPTPPGTMMGPGYGPGMMMGGPQGTGTGYGPGMMGHMMGQGMGPGATGMGSGYGTMPCTGATGERDLSTEDVKNILEGRLAWAGQKRLKVGTVKKTGEDTFAADIVTVDKSLVERLEVNRKTGFTRRIE